MDGPSWIDDLIDYTPLFALRMRPCCIRFTLGHGAELGKGRGAIPYQVDLGWYLDVMTLLSGRTLRGSILFSVLPGSGWFLLSTPMSLAPGFFGVYHRRDAVFIGIINGRGRHPDSKVSSNELVYISQPLSKEFLLPSSPPPLPISFHLGTLHGYLS